MGVSGLLSHCLRNPRQCVQEVDLVEIARQRAGIELLVDYYGFQHLLISNMWKSLAAVSKNDYLRIIGGEYGFIDAYITRFITDLQSLDIYLVMFVDGAKGSSQAGAKQKLDTWQFRHKQDMKKLRNILEVCSGKRSIQNLASSNSVRPVLLEVQIFETLKACKCEVVQCSSGEADYIIVRNLQSRPRAYAIISNDSDFCIFQESMFIPNDLFDLEGDLQLGQPQPFTDKPLRLKVGVISANKVVSMFGFENQMQLVEMSILRGNDFTSQFVTRLQIRGLDSIPNIAGWIKQYRKIENHPELAKELQHNRAFAESVQHSRQFYMLTLPVEEPAYKSNLSHFIDDGIQHGHYPANIMGMHLNFYWHRMLLEDCSYGAPSSENALMELRSCVYRMVLDRKEKIVVEYGRTPWAEFSSTPVYAAYDRMIRTVDMIDQDKIFLNLKTFGHIMSHMESPDSNPKYIDKYGRKNGFICYVLRYFLTLNAGTNLHISEDEFMVVVATAFGRLEEPWYHPLPLRPSTRCVTVANWLQNVYRHAYLFLGKLLHLTHEFPLPKEFFCGAVFTAFYVTTMCEGPVPDDCLMRIRGEMKHILHEKRHMITKLVTGVFDFNPRF